MFAIDADNPSFYRTGKSGFLKSRILPNGDQLTLEPLYGLRVRLCLYKKKDPSIYTHAW